MYYSTHTRFPPLRMALGEWVGEDWFSVVFFPPLCFQHRFEELHHRLAHIKMMVVEYDAARASQ